MSRPRIAIAGNLRWNAGFSETVANYVAAAPGVGCEIAVAAPVSRMDAEVPKHLPVVEDLGWATHLVVMFEARQFLSDEQRELVSSIPRARRVVIDFDGHYDPDAATEVGPGPVTAWRELYRELSDLVLLPKLGGRLPPGAAFFPCMGMPATVRRPPLHGDTDYDLQYIGSNWWRWDPLTEVVEAALAAEPALSRIRVCGRWWDGEVCVGHERASANEPGWLRERGVEVAPAVAFGRVVAEMGRSLVSPVLVRPLVAGTGLLTPRMFETLASGSVPVLPPAAEFMAELYGDGCEKLMLGKDPATTLGRIATNRRTYARVVAEIMERVRERYSYRRVLDDLLGFLGCRGDGR
ncbi:glycosyltransferase family 1 protein [Dactylosporangium roseum]|uniref:Glycosyltransferase family 1 protein n=1 Tax=Dactylosporangium roseum TaxID=47989 RepID=A0ABY5Z1Y2_9ACTN|nr:glycosyltransferase [Dactylosporangium roseum]UWZ34758.1 glycosyltransferase family 1 protein [Dactylosporangium roseum]